MNSKNELTLHMNLRVVRENHTFGEHRRGILFSRQESSPVSIIYLVSRKPVCTALWNQTQFSLVAVTELFIRAGHDGTWL